MLSDGFELSYEVSVLVEVIDNGVIREALNALLHVQVLIDGHFETAPHFLVVYLVLLPRELLFLKVNHILHLGAHIKLEAFVYFLFNEFHFFHHECFLALSTLHVLNALLLDAI